MKRWSLAALLVVTVTLPAAAGAHTDFTGRVAKPPAPPRQLLVALTGSGRGSWNGTDVYDSVKDDSRLPVERSGQISYSWKSVKPLSFTIPPYRDQPFDVTAQGDLTGSWQSSGSGTKVDSSYTTVEPFTCSDRNDDIPTPVNAELSYQPSDGHALLTLSPDAVFFFPSVPVDCRVIYAEANVTALGGIVAQNLFQSPDVEAQLLLPSDFVTVPKAVTVNFPHERVDTRSADASVHVVNDGTVNVNPCGGFGDGVVTFVKGDASAGDDALALGSPVSSGSTITTKGRTQLEIRLPDKSVLRIGPGSTVELTCAVFGKSAEDRKVNAKLVVGDIWAKIAHAVGGDAKFEVQSGPAGGGVRGSIMEVTSDHKKSHWHDIEGDMYVYSLSAPGKKVYTKPGHCIDSVGTAPPGRPYRC